PGRPLRLTMDPAADTIPAWSPDGRSIAFVRRHPDKTEILMVPALGGSERQLAEFQASRFSQTLSWSPDGRWLVVGAGKPNVISLVAVETGEKRQLTFPPASFEGDRYGVLSPDGRTLAFLREIGTQASDLYALSLADNFVP